ncbi:Twinfilin-1 [Podochytrium sp. JEL0797]|nr:Twinfilin-1 [Podochytrium sp. JEL0797]
MALSGGISCSSSLISSFSTPGNVFAFCVGVTDEQLVVRGTLECAGESFASNFASLANQDPFFLAKEPSFVLVRLLDEGVGWLMVLYVPDAASVRDKMLYASCKAALARELGDVNFTDFLHATTRDECSLAGYESHRKHKDAEAPRTEKELEIQALKLTETGAEIGMSTRKEIASGVGFAFTQEAEVAMGKLRDGELNLVALSIDSNSETIHVGVSSDEATPDNLKHVVPEGQPFFVFFKYLHDNEGASQDPVLFFYICPPSSKVKARMLFSSSRASTLDHVEKNLGIAVAKKIEIDSPSEIDQSFVNDALYPPKPEALGSTRGEPPQNFLKIIALPRSNSPPRKQGKTKKTQSAKSKAKAKKPAKRRASGRGKS